jgi:hypothetical protein
MDLASWGLFGGRLEVGEALRQGGVVLVFGVGGEPVSEEHCQQFGRSRLFLLLIYILGVSRGGRRTLARARWRGRSACRCCR